jgi:hypothetical protein
MIQVCRKCNETKPIEDYQFHRVSGKYYQTCRRCRQLQAYAWAANNKDKHNASQRKWRQKNPDREWRVRNPEKSKESVKIATREWTKRNPEYHHNHYLANKAVYVANRARRRALQDSATPIWLTAINKAQIQEMYDIAKARKMQTSVDYHVDHIIPINGENVSGLHVPWNLQVITAKENLQKGNKSCL